MEKQSETIKRPYHKKHLITAFIALLWIIASLVFIILTQEPKPDPGSEKIIREAAALQFGRFPRYITDQDLTKITNFVINGKELCDIKTLSAFTNLKQLELSGLGFPESRIPKWISILAKYRIVDLRERFCIDLSPLENLYSLDTLRLSGSQVNDVKPLAKLINLTELDLSRTLVSNIESLKALVNLQRLNFYNTCVSDLEPLKGLKSLKYLNLNGTGISDISTIGTLVNLEVLAFDITNVSDLEPIKGFSKLKSLSISNTRVTNLEPIKSLASLNRLEINETAISDLEPIKSLTNLKILLAINCIYITDDEFNDLRKALPELRIIEDLPDLGIE